MKHEMGNHNINGMSDIQHGREKLIYNSHNLHVSQLPRNKKVEKELSHAKDHQKLQRQQTITQKF